MFKIRDKVQIDGDMFVRSILGLELQDDGQVYCWVDGMIEQVNVKHIHLVTPSDIQQDYSPGDRVCWAHGTVTPNLSSRQRKLVSIWKHRLYTKCTTLSTSLVH